MSKIHLQITGISLHGPVWRPERSIGNPVKPGSPKETLDFSPGSFIISKLVYLTKWFNGKVTNKYIENGEHLGDCESWAENQRKETNTNGWATIWLPSRASSGQDSSGR